MNRFENKVCLVAGGARGIGAQVARQIVAEGGKTVIGDIRDELGLELAQELGPDNALFQKLDVTDAQSVEAFVAAGKSRFGTVDHLVCSAIRIHAASLLELTLEQWNDTINIGLSGPFLCAQAFVRQLMGEGKTGSLVNISSISGRFPYTNSGSYSAVKAGLIRFTEQLALELAPHGIRANVVAPAHVETPLLSYLKDPAILKAREASTPLGRVGRPDDIAKAILYLLSDDAAWVTATTLDIDGGIGKSVLSQLSGRKWD